MESALESTLHRLLEILSLKYFLKNEDLEFTIPAEVYDRLLLDTEFRLGPKTRQQVLVFQGAQARVILRRKDVTVLA